MAAKLQEELSARERSKLGRTMDAPIVAGLLERAPKVPLLCARSYEGLAETCRSILLNLTLTQNDNDVNDILSSLKNAQEIALKMIGGFHMKHRLS
jgi:DNA mismatch repair protein MSH3